MRLYCFLGGAGGRVRTKILNEKEIFHTCIPLTNDDVKKIIVKNNIKKLAKESYLNTKQIISEVFKNLDSAEISKISKHRSIYRMINRVRDEKNFNYDSTNDIPSELKTTINGTKYLKYDSGVLDKERIIILANSERLMFLKNSDTWLSDGTFKMAPYNFHQIYIIYTKIFDNYIPIVYGILSSKNENAYLKFFIELKKLVDIDQPKYWILDFESAPIKIAKKILIKQNFIIAFSLFTNYLERYPKKWIGYKI